MNTHNELLEVQNKLRNCVQFPIEGVVYPKQSELDGYLKHGALTDETMVDGFKKIVATYPDNVALLGDGVRISYVELDERSSKLGAAFLLQGLRPLDRVVFQLKDSEQLVIAFIACLKAGLIPICTLYAHREHEIGFLANLAEARLHVVQGDDPKFDSVEFALKMREQVESLEWIMQVRGEHSSGVLLQDELIAGIDLELANKVLSEVKLDPFQVAVFQLSGGTTGVPKIIPRFHNEYLYNMRAVSKWLGYKEDDVLFMPQPMVHNLNMGCCFGPFLMTGGTVTIVKDLQPESMISLIQNTKPTWLMLGGPIIVRLESAVMEWRIDLSNGRGIIVANNPDKIRSKFGLPAYNVFGITEGVIMFTKSDDPLDALNLSNGRPVSEWDSVRILTPGTEEDVQAGDVGEPAFKGPYTTHGYYRAEERNKETFTSDGYYRSGDLMYTRVYEGKTYYFFCGRIKDLVSRAGEKINCQEVESAVAGHPAIAAVAAVGYPDPIYDERLCAAIVLRENHKAPTVEELGQYLKDYGMAKYKWPERIEVLSEFPMTASGKLSKVKLKDLIWDRIKQLGVSTN